MDGVQSDMIQEKIYQIQSPYKYFERKLRIIEIKSMYLRPYTFEDFFLNIEW